MYTAAKKRFKKDPRAKPYPCVGFGEIAKQPLRVGKVKACKKPRAESAPWFVKNNQLESSWSLGLVV